MSSSYAPSDRSNQHNQRKPTTPKVILDLSRHANREVQVRLSGGRQVRGILKGWDPLLNLVLDQAVEDMRVQCVDPDGSGEIWFAKDPLDTYRLSGKQRNLGLMVCRGTSVMTISPMSGVEQIDNPFLGQSAL